MKAVFKMFFYLLTASWKTLNPSICHRQETIQWMFNMNLANTQIKQENKFQKSKANRRNLWQIHSYDSSTSFIFQILLNEENLNRSTNKKTKKNNRQTNKQKKNPKTILLNYDLIVKIQSRIMQHSGVYFLILLAVTCGLVQMPSLVCFSLLYLWWGWDTLISGTFWNHEVTAWQTQT